MGPFEDMGQYHIMTTTTRKADDTDNKPGMWHVVIGILLLGPALWVVAFMGLFLWRHIGLISVVTVMGLCFWACGHYGTNHSILDRFRYRTTSTQRARISRRLSDIKESRNK